MQVIGLLRHTRTSQFSVLNHVFGFISGENLDKYSILEKIKIMVGELRGGREQGKGKMGSFLGNIPVLCFNLVCFLNLEYLESIASGRYINETVKA